MHDPTHHQKLTGEPSAACALAPPPWLFTFPHAPARGLLATGSGLLSRVPAPVLRGVARWAVDSVFEAPNSARRIARTSDETRPLLGNASISAQILGDAASIAGGIRSLVLQAWHPLVMAGVDQHSGYEDDPIRRLQNTTLWVDQSARGSWPTVAKLARAVRGMHQRVEGSHEGTRYQAGDPHHLAWVQMTFTESILLAARTWGLRRLTRAEQDQFIREQSWVGALLDPSTDIVERPQRPSDLELDALPMIRNGTLPVSAAQLHHRLESYRDELGLTDAALATLDFLRDPPDVPTVLRPAYRIFFGGIASTLPDELIDPAGGWRGAAQGGAAVNVTGAVLALIRSTAGRTHAEDKAKQRESQARSATGGA